MLVYFNGYLLTLYQCLEKRSNHLVTTSFSLRSCAFLSNGANMKIR
jgi:hypothetical protein